MSATEDQITTLKQEGELEEDEGSSEEEGSEEDNDESDDEEGEEDDEVAGEEDEEWESEEEDGEDEGEDEWEEDGEVDGETSDEDVDEEEDTDEAEREGDHVVDDSSGDENCDRCPICLNRLRSQDIGTPETCDHCFCLECIQEWAKVTNTCPVDRQVFRIVLARHAGEEKIYKQFPVEDNKQDNEEEEDPTFCEVCGQSDREDRLLLCDGCDLGYHCECLDPPLASVPVHEWFCPDCQDRRNAATIDEHQHLGRQIARTRISERVRRIIADARAERAQRRTRIAQMIDDNESFMDQEPAPRPSTSASSSGTRKKRKTTRKRKRKTTRKGKTTKRKTKKGKTRRKRKTTGKRKRKTKRKTKRKPTATSSGLARTVRVSSTSVKARIADKLGLSKPPAGRSIPLQKLPTNTRQESVAARAAAEYGAATFSILGSKDELYLFADHEGEERQIVNRPAIPAERLLSNSAKSSHLPLSFSPTKRKVVKEPPAASIVNSSTSSATFDLLGSIMQNQDLLHKGSRHVTINRDGTLSAAKSENKHLKKNLSTSDQPAIPTSHGSSLDCSATKINATVSWSSGSPQVSSSAGSGSKTRSPETSLSKLQSDSSKTSIPMSSQLAELEADFRAVADSDEELVNADSGLADVKPKTKTTQGKDISGSQSELKLSSESKHEATGGQVRDEVGLSVIEEVRACHQGTTDGSVLSERLCIKEKEDLRGKSILKHTNSEPVVRAGDITQLSNVGQCIGHLLNFDHPVCSDVHRNLDEDIDNKSTNTTVTSNSLPALNNCNELNQEPPFGPGRQDNIRTQHCSFGGEEKAEWSVDKEEGEASDTDDERRQQEEEEGDGDKEEGEIVDEGDDGEKLTIENSGEGGSIQWLGGNVKLDAARKRCLSELEETEDKKKIRLEDVRSTGTESMADPVSDDDSDEDDNSPDKPVNASFMMANFLHSLKTNEFDRKKEKALRKEMKNAEEAKSKEELERETVEKDKANHVISILDFIGNESARKFGLPSVSVKENKPREYRGPAHRNNGGGDVGDRFNYRDRKQNYWSARWKSSEDGESVMEDGVPANRPFDKKRLPGQQDYKQRPRSGSQDSRAYSQRSGSHDSRLSKSRHRSDSTRDRGGKEKRSPRRKDKRRKSRDDEDDRKNQHKKSHKRTKWKRKEETSEDDSSDEEGSEKNIEEEDEEQSGQVNETLTNCQPQSSEGPPLMPGHYAPPAAPHPSYYPPPPGVYPNPRASIPQTHPLHYGQPPYIPRPTEAPPHLHPPRPAYGQPGFPPSYVPPRYPHPIPHQTNPGAVPQHYVSSYYRHPNPTAAATLPTTVGSVSRPPLSHAPPPPHTTSQKPSHISQHPPHGPPPLHQPLGAHGSHPQGPPQRHPVYAPPTRHPLPHIPVTTHPHAVYTTQPHPTVAAHQYASHLSSNTAYMQRQPTSHQGAAPHSSVVTTYPSSHPASHPSSHPANHPASHPANHPSSHPANHPSSHPASHPSSHPASHPSSHPASHPSSHHPSHPGTATAGVAAQRNAYPTSGKQEMAPRNPPTTHLSQQRSETSTQYWSESSSNSRSDSHRKKDFTSLSPREERKPSSYCISPPRTTIKGVTTYDKVDSSILLNEVKKGFRQLVEDAVRCALKPAWSSKKITKDEYKDIFKRAVEKVCGSKETVVHQEKIQSLVSAYVIKARKARTS